MMSMKRDLINCTRSDDHRCYRFMSLKGTAAIDVLTLVIAFFSLFRKVATTFGMGGCKAYRTMHHFWCSFVERITLNTPKSQNEQFNSRFVTSSHFIINL